MSHHQEVEAPHPHVIPLAVYFGVFGALVALTLLTVAVTWVDLGPFNIVVAMGIAAVKAALVGAIFMHLWFDHKIYTVTLFMGLIFMSVFFLFSLMDMETRALVDPVKQNFLPRDEQVQKYREENPDGPELRAYTTGFPRVPSEEEQQKLHEIEPGH